MDPTRNEGPSHSSMDVDVRPVTDNAAVSRGASEEGRTSSVPVPASDLAVGFVYAPEMLLHSFESSDPEADHPERPERIAKIHEVLMENGCIVRMKKIPIRRVKREEVLLVHSELHWNSVLRLQCECINA